MGENYDLNSVVGQFQSEIIAKTSSTLEQGIGQVQDVFNTSAAKLQQIAQSATMPLSMLNVKIDALPAQAKNVFDDFLRSKKLLAPLGVPQDSDSSEMRAVLSALHPEDVYSGGGAGILGVLEKTGGVIFPYTPTIVFNQAVTYTDLQLVHSNTDYPAYARTPSVTLSVTGKFTVQNQAEGVYALAVIHFLRSVSKSYFGEKDAANKKAGLPPPVLKFSAYGPYVFNQLRCVLKSHSWTFDENMDTIAVQVPTTADNGGGTVRLPAMFTIQTELMVVQTPARMRREFSFDLFRSGALMGGGGGYL